MHELNGEELVAFAKKFTISFHEDLMQFPLIKEQKQLLPYSVVKQKGFIPIKESIDAVEIAFIQPNFHLHSVELKLILGKKIIQYIIKKKD